MENEMETGVIEELPTLGPEAVNITYIGLFGSSEFAQGYLRASILPFGSVAKSSEVYYPRRNYMVGGSHRCLGLGPSGTL